MTLTVPPELHHDLLLVEHLLHERTRARATIISMVNPHLIANPTDRLRALLVLTVARLGGATGEHVAHAAAAVELIEAATRAHNNLIDEQARRLGRVKNGAWDHGVALMVGDYLFALASGEMALSPDPRIIGLYSHAVMQICEGQLTTVTNLIPHETALATYWQRAEALAGALPAAAAQAGILCSNLPDTFLAPAARLGKHLGLARQLAAEIRDLESQGSFIQSGQAPLALILAAGAAPPDEIQAVFAHPTPETVAAALPVIRTHGLPLARESLAAQQRAAHQALSELPVGSTTPWLATLIEQSGE
ncbi:MAG: polyprenyl synthetase [Chloroflexus sp.]|uniref:polyprenyl synthetase family protein n=1 Tax=Chloroflexus sp. TaxID=1904827 RepID=UPI0021DF1905|nr:polyprenyl synthetase family protein [Chloroflexus sp.]GIV87728.1 MAG: polyprenyl synthetase [Chloroflexus sp.]